MLMLTIPFVVSLLAVMKIPWGFSFALIWTKTLSQ